MTAIEFSQSGNVESATFTCGGSLILQVDRERQAALLVFAGLEGLSKKLVYTHNALDAKNVLVEIDMPGAEIRVDSYSHVLSAAITQ
ncbi:MAG: hypothetical protein K2M06_01880 [Muribaculaceae bacterium]|nr:hypothetical protein [Muribaculaceae bacterium]